MSRDDGKVIEEKTGRAQGSGYGGKGRMDEGRKGNSVSGEEGKEHKRSKEGREEKTTGGRVVDFFVSSLFHL